MQVMLLMIWILT